MMEMSTPKTKPSKAQVIEELWRRGNLAWKCHKVQKEMYDIFYNAPKNSTLVWLLARQSGKSYLLSIIAIETALRKPNSIVKLLTDTKVHMRNIILPIFTELLKDCPEDIKPEYFKSDYVFSFPNGSQIQLAGSDGGNYERLRGQKSELILVDEAGFCSNLEDVVKSVLLPTTTHTGGNIVLASTPSPDPDHDFVRFIEEAELKGTLSKKTIYDNPLLSKEQIDRIIDQMNGVNSPKFRREYLCEIIREEEVVVFPELTPEHLDAITKDWPKPPFYDCYIGMDLGYKDLTAVLFGYYDFRSDKVIIEDEIVVKGKDLKLPNLADAILEKEDKLWTNIYTNEKIEPTLRVSDINYIVTAEMARHTHNRLIFVAAKKDDNEAAVNNLRVMLANGKIIINPRCVTLLRHLRNCRWDKRVGKNGFDRSPDDGHYDTVDALKYLVRHVSYKRNPYPVGHNIHGSSDNIHVVNPDKYKRGSNDTMNIYQKIFGVKKVNR